MAGSIAVVVAELIELIEFAIRFAEIPEFFTTRLVIFEGDRSTPTPSDSAESFPLVLVSSFVDLFELECAPSELGMLHALRNQM